MSWRRAKEGAAGRAADFARNVAQSGLALLSSIFTGSLVVVGLIALPFVELNLRPLCG